MYVVAVAAVAVLLGLVTERLSSLCWGNVCTFLGGVEMQHIRAFSGSDGQGHH